MKLKQLNGPTNINPGHLRTGKRFFSLMKATFQNKVSLEIGHWPGNSPDINSIENLWFINKSCLLKKDCTTVRQLMEAVIEVWYRDPKIARKCKTLIQSMLNRFRDLLNSVYIVVTTAQIKKLQIGTILFLVSINSNNTVVQTTRFRLLPNYVIRTTAPRQFSIFQSGIASLVMSYILCSKNSNRFVKNP